MFQYLLHHLLYENLEQRRDRVLLIDGETQWTFGELAAQAEAVALWLRERGVARGDRVVVHLRKSRFEVAAMLGASLADATFVNVNAQWTAKQLEYVIEDSGARFLLTDARAARLCEEEQIGGGIEAILGLQVESTQGRVHPWPTPSPSTRGIESRFAAIDRDLAAILYTSGSTGSPKGVMLSHANLLAGARSVAQYLHNDESDRLLSLLPFSFDYGLSQLTTMLLVGGSLVLQGVAMATEVRKSILEHDVTGFAAVPPAWSQFARLLDESPEAMPNLRYVTNSGGKIPGPTLESMRKHMPNTDIVLMYGLTEAFRSTYLPPDQFEAKKGSMGYAVPNAEVFVVNEKDGICGPGQRGELVHRGALVSQGYWGRPEATAEKIRPCPQLKDRIGDEPVVFSGDLVELDEDGALWFVSRMDGLIKSSGFRVSPTEVEEVVHAFGGIGDVVAFGVDDEELGQAIHVVLTTTEGRGEDFTTKLRRHLQREMPHYMVPREIHVHDGALPRNSNGKLDRPRIVQSFREASPTE